MLDSAVTWLQDTWQTLSTMVGSLGEVFTSEVYPLIQPLWDDQLWRALIVVFLLIASVFIGLWLLKNGATTIQSVFDGGIALLKTLLKPFASWGDKLLQILKSVYSNFKRQSRRNLSLKIRVERISKAFQYLTTSTNWRYKTACFLLIGEVKSGKSSLLASIRNGRRVSLVNKEKSLNVAGGKWHFFDHGAVVDVDGGVLEVDTQETNRSLLKLGSDHSFSSLLDVLHRHRPERAIDGVILTLSAESLLAAKTTNECKVLGELLYQQLFKVQKNTGFVIPIYLVITKCDKIESFSSFWQSQAANRKNEMLGWSNPYRLETEFDSDWIDKAFEELSIGLQYAQLEIAASNRPISNVDKFMLFQQHFSRLHDPLKTTLESALSWSQFQVPAPLRGIYFTGKLGEDIAFSEQLFSQKIFAESNLATPVERKLLSSERTLRKFQYASIVVGIVASIWLGIDWLRMSHYNADLERVLSQVAKKQSYYDQDCSALGLKSYQLLADLAEVGFNPSFPSIPISWFDGKFQENQVVVAKAFLAPKLFKSLDCRLRVRAKQLSERRSRLKPDLDFDKLQSALGEFSQALITFNQKKNDFLALAGPLGNNRSVTVKLKGLLDYLYDSPTPEAAIPREPLITGAVQRMEYTASWKSKVDSCADGSKQKKSARGANACRTVAQQEWERWINKEANLRSLNDIAKKLKQKIDQGAEIPAFLTNDK